MAWHCGLSLIMGVQSRVLWWPEASLASVVVVRVCALHWYAAESASSVEVEEDILSIGVDYPFVARLTLWYGWASSTPCEASDSAEGLVKESRHRSERFLRRAPAGIRRVACRTAGERGPLQAHTVQRSALALAGKERESWEVGSASCVGYIRADEPHAAPSSCTYAWIVGILVTLPHRLSRSILSISILVPIYIDALYFRMSWTVTINHSHIILSDVPEPTFI